MRAASADAGENFEVNDAVLTNNVLEINLADNTTIEVAADEFSLYNYGGEISAASSTSGVIDNNTVIIKGNLKNINNIGSAGVLKTGLITGGSSNVGADAQKETSLSGNSVLIDNAVIQKSDTAYSFGIFGAYTYLGIQNNDKDYVSKLNDNKVIINNSAIDADVSVQHIHGL
ncbi:hypothetical protein [Campylobacter sp. US33a]|uniref:hypothetical protein n=1 Tax=Campylobacter sp. US33a TaxID=2498120 RepID=UPI00106793D9|nr:hypothetical protein [Campylobacter sp. US33a]TEY02018.1 hypothetical protein ELQ16_06600 [Campylobacter sp. US33a]